MRHLAVSRRFAASLTTICVTFSVAATAFAGTILNQTTPIVVGPIQSDCTGEDVILEGKVHTLVHFGESGDRVHFGEDVRFTDMKGTALLTGAQYVEMDVQNTQANITALGQQEITAERTMNLTRLGEDKTFGDGDDWRVHVIAHMTVNANGVVTVDKVDERNECR